MKNLKSILVALSFLLTISTIAQSSEKYISTKTHIKFFSTTPVEDIEANNYAAVSTIEPASGNVVFSVPMQSFEFEKALMQKHFNNEHFLESSVYPKSKFKGNITNLEDIDFEKNGIYKTQIEGTLTIKDKSKKIKESGTIEVKGKTLLANTSFSITLADFGISFDAKEMVSTKIGKTVEITFKGEYKAK